MAKKTHVEDETVRTIRNPDPIHPVRYDFYQLMRKWRVDVRRYGVRFTYQLFVPNPAGSLLDLHWELTKINQKLEQGITLGYSANELTRENYLRLASQYSAAVEAPPSLTRSVQTILWKNSDSEEEEKQKTPYHTLRISHCTVPIPEGYVYSRRFYVPVVPPTATYTPSLPGPTGAKFYPPWIVLPLPEPKHPHITVDLTNTDASQSDSEDSSLTFLVLAQGTTSLWTSLTVWFTVTDEHFRDWQAKTYNAIKKAAETQFTTARRQLEERKSRIVAELEAQDSLTLRKLEREQLMRAVAGYLVPGLKTHSDDKRTGQHGRLVTFLHQAIEWENINYVLYPHFWGEKKQSELQRNLRHHDPFHEAFLRAGAARVFLTIKPGHEEDFFGFIKNGNTSELAQDGLYAQIADELQRMAQTQYAGIRVPTGDGASPCQRKGQWPTKPITRPKAGSH